ncbi:MAG: lysylphosphatidylglycerol synthase transmembrane domain-containing protein [Chloroflexaceae bacterium]
MSQRSFPLSKTNQTIVSRHRKLVWTLVRVGLAVALVAVVATHVRTQELTALWRNLAWPWLAGATLCFWLICLLMSLRAWHVLDRRVPASALLELTVLQTVTGNLIASSAGVASYVALLMARYGVTLRQSVWTVLLTRFADGAALLACLAFSSAALWGAITPLRWPITLLIGGLSAAALALSLLFARRQQALAAVQRLMAATGMERTPFLRKVFARLAEAPPLSSREAGRHGLPLIIYSCAIMLAQFAFSYCSLRMFGVALDPLIVLFVLTLNLLVAMAPIQIFGGLGVVEVTSLYLYGLFEIGEGVLAPVLLSGRAAFYLINLATLLYLPLSGWMQTTGAQRRDGPAEAPCGGPQQQ